MFLFLLPLISPVQGASQSDVLKQQLAQKQATLNQAYSQLRALESELDQLAEQKSAAAERLADLEIEVSDVQDDIAQAQQDLENVRTQLEDRLVSMYKDGSTWSVHYLEILVMETDLASVLERFDMITKIANQDQELFTEVKGYLEESLTKKALLEKKKTEQQSQLDELVRVQEQLSAKQAQFASQYQRLLAQVASLREDIRRAEALEAAAAAAAAAQLKAVADAAKASSDKTGATTPTTTPGTTPTTKPKASGNVSPPTSAAEIKAQADFIYWTYLKPRKSVLTGQMVMDIWIKYGISPAGCLAVLNAESGMGSLRWGGRLVSEANNFGCMSYRENPSWLQWPPAISHGKIYVGGRAWMTFPTVAEGMEAWGRMVSNGLGRDVYRPLIRAGDWEAFADIYYGKNVPGKAKYIERLQWAYGMLKSTARAAGYNW